MTWHVVWDWNGTLFSDLEVVVEAANVALRDIGEQPMEVATYQRLFTRPVRQFYDRLLDREVSDAEWERLDRVFHDAYADLLHQAELDAGALAALEAVEQAGGTQSLLSMWRHDELLPLVDELGIGDRFVRVDGLRDDLGGGRKARYMDLHLRELERHLAGLSLGHVRVPDHVLVVGDAMDDADAAAHVGARCVLFDGGTHQRHELDLLGVPVAESLVEALTLGGLLS